MSRNIIKRGEINISTLRVFEAFSGIGTQRMALRNIGVNHEVVGISEIDESAIKSYNAIHGETKNYGDISKLNIDEIPDHDLFTYSFPCQDISLIGSKGGFEEGSNTQSSLLWECRRVIQGKKPKYLLLENVKNLVGKKNKPLFDKWINWLDEQGYNSYTKTIKASDFCDIPQARSRVFVVSIRKDLNQQFEFVGNKTTKTFTDFLESDLPQEDVSLKEFFINNSLKMEARGNGFRFRIHIPGVSKNVYTITTRTGSRMDDNFVFYGLSEHEQEVISQVLNTNDSFVVNKANVEHLEQSGIDIHQLGIRTLTPREVWRLMGCADEDFDKAERVIQKKAPLYEQGGNAIVVGVLENIFKELLLKGAIY